MVWPIKPDGVAICENVRSEAHEGQSQRYQFTKTQRAVERIECSIAAFAGTYKAGSSRPRRKMSAAARARISAAQKARWAKTKGQKVFPSLPSVTSQQRVWRESERQLRRDGRRSGSSRVDIPNRHWDSPVTAQGGLFHFNRSINLLRF